jgi:hypothetical protein
LQRKCAATIKIQRAWKRYRDRLREEMMGQLVVNIQRQWRAKRAKRVGLESVEVNDEAAQHLVKAQFLATLDFKLAENPLYLINLLKSDEQVVRLTQHVESIKKLAVTRSHDLKATTSKLSVAKNDILQLEAANAAGSNASKNKGVSGSSSDSKELLCQIDQLQKWIGEKEKSRVSALEELGAADSQMTSMMFDAAQNNQEITNVETTLDEKTRAFKDFEFSLVKTSKTAEKVDYDIKTKKFELKSLQDKLDGLYAAAVHKQKAQESLKALCIALNKRIQNNSPVIQMAEMNFGLQSLHEGVTQLFAKDNRKERLKAPENESKLLKAQSKKSTASKRMASFVGTDNLDSPINNKISFRNFEVEKSSVHLGDHVLPKYAATTFGEVGQTAVTVAKANRNNVKVKNLAPPVNVHGHKWKSKFLTSPTWCMFCKSFIKGLTINQQHAFQCVNCKVIGHRECCHDLKCQCKTVTWSVEKEILAPVDRNDHMWESKPANVEDKCELCEKYICDKEPGKGPFQCRRCKVFGHRDCCAQFSCNRCEGKHSPRKDNNANTGPAVSHVSDDVMMTLDTFVKPTLEVNGHKFKNKFLTKPTYCGYCAKFIVGLTAKQQDAVKCSLCKESCHRKCANEFNEGKEAKRRICSHSHK